MNTANISDILPPEDIRSAATKISTWMETNGYKNWQLNGICDRRIADQRDTLRGMLDSQETRHRLDMAEARETIAKMHACCAHLDQQIAAERALADRLAESISTWNARGNFVPPYALESLTAWKEARNT